MWWFRPSFKKKFTRIKGGWSSSQVCELLGNPKETEETVVPLGSDWGSQRAMTFRMKGGDPVKQWMYEYKGEFFYLWFAKVSYAEDDPWRVTLIKKTDRRLAA